MRTCRAPEVRGPRFELSQLAAFIGLLALSVLSHSLAAGAEATQRNLLAAAVESKPTFTLSDLEGSPHELQRHAGKTVLVHFFATWCEPCREELASLSRLAVGPSRGRISIVAVNIAEVPARISRFLAAQPVPFPVLLDVDRSVARAWGVSVLPTTFVLDRGLQSRLFVEGDLDWLRPDVLAALERVGAHDTTSQDQ